MAKGVTVAQESYRWPEVIANAAASMVCATGLPLGSLDPDSIEAAARRSTGLHDWGGESFRGVLRELIRLLEGAGITPLARLASRQILIKAVSNRLRIREHVRTHPEVADVQVQRPIFIVGFPRTGTTVLQNLLACHPDRRALQFWELTAPVPEYPDPAEDERRRVASTERMLRFAYRVAPEMGEVHWISATTPEECWSLFANTMAVLNYEFQSGIAAFGDHLMAQDMSWAYREYREMLQILLHQRPAGQLVLKCPEHLWFLDALLEVFPDAAVVWTHRDPFPTIASYCSLISMNRRFYYGRFSPPDVGRHIAERFAVGIERAMAVRERVGPSRFFDLTFDELVPDPIAAVHRVHEHFGFERSAAHDAAMAAWLESGREDERGKHRYDAERYGLDRDAIHARYARYIETFGVPTRG
jgi:hypothetical protein